MILFLSSGFMNEYLLGIIHCFFASDDVICYICWAKYIRNIVKF